MANITRTFNTYLIRYYTGYGDGREALLELYEGATTAGYIYFYRDDVALPANTSWTSGDITAPVLYYRTSRFQDVIDILREESPVKIIVNTDAKTGYITTDREAVGEEEGA